MPNPITGDFEAVLQVSGGTINRLLASLHQNAFADPTLPSLPHQAKMRLGDLVTIDGVHGLVHAQIGVPRVELIHGATDRFILEVSVRAWFRPDAGSAPFPGFINGTVRAEYRIADIDPSCEGWDQHLASKYLWIRVVKESVTFQGTAADDRGPADDLVAIAQSAATDAQNIAKVQRQIAGLLDRQFEATPHPITPGFRRDLLRSLNVPIGGSAVAMAVGLGGADPVGAMASVDNVILQGADLGLGVSIDHLLSLAQPLLDQIAQLNLTVPVHVDLPLKDFDTVYRVTVDPPTLTWEPHDWYGLFTVKLHGTAKTASVAANATFDAAQTVMLQFDGGASKLVASAAAPIVSVSATGLYNGTAAGETYKGVLAAVQDAAAAAINQIQPVLDALPGQTATLVKQLQTLDAKAQVGFTRASFLRDGIVLLGTVALSERHAAIVQHQRLPSLDGHTALESWIPGGRIDRFEWSWTWTQSATPGGKASYDQRFLLRRPRGQTGQWGPAMALSRPLPGLDGFGSVCLTLRGVQVDAVTGALTPVVTQRVCHRFGLVLPAEAFTRARLMVRQLPPLEREVPFPQLALERLGNAGTAADAANLLVVFPGRRWSEETAAALREGIRSCGRYDAGLAVLVLFQEGLLEAVGPRLFAEIEGLVRSLGLHVIVNEDVHGGWSRAFDVEASGQEPAWALLSPQGTVTWRHRGRASGEILTAALDTHLYRSLDLKPERVRSGVEVGSQLRPGRLRPGLTDVIGSHCPPLPDRGIVGKPHIVTFVQKDDASSRAHLGALYAEYGQRGGDAPLVVVVVDRATAREAEALKDAAGVDFVAVPDLAGAIGDDLGVGTWPTTMTVDGAGTVSEVEIGVRSRRK